MRPADPTAAVRAPDEKIGVVTALPFFAVHVAALVGPFLVGVSWQAVVLCLALYVVRMWGITAGYHRYFSHRAYKTGRVFQFVLAWVGAMSAQKGPLWWAAHHRHHHRESDTELDLHSPTQKGFWWSHVGWVLCPRYDETRLGSIKDFARFPELLWLNTWHLVPPVTLAVALFLVGGGQALVWGFFVSTVLLWHGTFTINSLSHIFGKRRYRTTDTSRNNWLLALLTLGEGWHNNHHYHQNTANQGWFWWEVDLSYYSLEALSWVGVVQDLRLPSEDVKYAFRRYGPEVQAELARPVGYFARAAAARRAAADRVREGAHAAAQAAQETVHAAGEKVRGAVAAAAERLPAPPPALPQQQ